MAKKRGIPRLSVEKYMTRNIPCPSGCRFKYSGIERDQHDNIVRVVSCENNCPLKRKKGR